MMKRLSLLSNSNKLMRMAGLSILIAFVCVSTAFGQRDAPVWESYLPKISISHDTSNRAVTVNFLFKKSGGPHEHTEHQAYVLVYLKKDEEQILKLAADPQLTSKKNEKTKRFLDLLVEKKLVVPLDSQVAKLTDAGFPFQFTFNNETLLKSVQALGNFNIKNVDVGGSYTWYEDKFKLMVFVPVNDSTQATKVQAKLREMYDFANLMDFEKSLLYFRPLPYEFGLKKAGEDLLLLYIN